MCLGYFLASKRTLGTVIAIAPLLRRLPSPAFEADRRGELDVFAIGDPEVDNEKLVRRSQEDFLRQR
jgi:hypothetical protein